MNSYLKFLPTNVATTTPSSTTVDMRTVPGVCGHCSTAMNAVFHLGPCPRVKAIEYYSNGAIKRVEYQ